MAASRKLLPLSESEMAQMHANASQASEFLKALAHESRLLLLCKLIDGEKPVGELEDALDIRQSTVSQQLARLRLEGLVKHRRDGRQVFYSIASDDVRKIIRALADIFCRP